MTLTVSIVCQQVGKPTKQYEIRVEGRKATPDLCADDAAPLEALLSGGEAPAPRKATVKKSTPPRRRTKVVSIEEIERLKAEGKA